MAKGQENGITILLRLEGQHVGQVKEEDNRIMVEVETDMGGVSCPSCGSAKLYRHGACKPRRALPWLEQWHEGLC